MEDNSLFSMTTARKNFIGFLTFSVLSICLFTLIAVPRMAFSAVDSSYSIPIILNNNQDSPTSNTFQQMVTFNPSSYSSYESDNLGNMRFCGDKYCNVMYYAWLQGCPVTCSTSSKDANVWIQLTKSIPAEGSLTIYMV